MPGNFIDGGQERQVEYIHQLSSSQMDVGYVLLVRVVLGEIQNNYLKGNFFDVSHKYNEATMF